MMCVLYMYMCTYIVIYMIVHSPPTNVITEVLDFTGLMRDVTLTPTDLQQCVTVMIEDDLVLEETESLTVSLSLIGDMDSIQVSQQTTTIVIIDNDSKRLTILQSLASIVSLSLSCGCWIYTVCVHSQ